MKLYYDKRLKDPTYYAQHGYRINGKVTTRNVKKFGKHSELLKITDDPLAYVKDQIKQMNEEYRVGRLSLQITTDFNQKIEHTDKEASLSTAKNIGYFFLQYFFGALDLKKFLSDIKINRRMTYDPYTILRFVTFSRILDPASKLATWNRRSSFFESPEFDYQHILRFMDLLDEHYEEYLTWLYKKSNSIVKRDTSVLYYDCTNFYFETEQADEDAFDEVTGELIQGFRKYGVSKEHRPNPIVQMGLFMDANGIPLTMSLQPGNTSEQVTAVPLEKEVTRMLDGSRFIYCADAGLGSYSIRKFNSMGGRSFIVTQSVKKLGATLKEAVFNDFDYRLLSDDRKMSLEYMKTFDRFDPDKLSLYNDKIYKVIPADRAVDLGLYEEKKFKNGKTRKVRSSGLLKQKVIITFSRKMMEYQRTIRNRQIERARKLVNNNDPEEIKKGPNDVRRFMKRVAETEDGKKAKVTYQIDEDKIREEEKYDGFYAVATNLDMPVREVLEISHQRYQIEDCFRIMKTNLSGRPINHRLPRRIKSHFLFCFTSLLIERILEVKLDRQGTHVTTNNLITTLKNMNVVNIQDIQYASIYEGSKALDALNKLIPLDLDRKYYRPSDLNKKIKKLLK